LENPRPVSLRRALEARRSVLRSEIVQGIIDLDERDSITSIRCSERLEKTRA